MNSAADLAAYVGVPNGTNLASLLVSAPAQARDIVCDFTGLTNGGTYQFNDRLPSGLAFVVDEIVGTVYLEAAFGGAVVYTTLPEVGSATAADCTLPCRDVVTIEDFTIGNKAQISKRQHWNSIVGKVGDGVRMFSNIIPPSCNFSVTFKNNYSAALTLGGELVLRGHYVPVS